MIGRSVALLAGVLFGVGLMVAGMTRPAKVLGFLDVTGRWDPSLALVMVGAIGVHAALTRLIRRRERPLQAATFQVPTRRDLDAPLLLGSALFGVGWGLGGYCPGPAVVSLGGGGGSALVFVAAMAGGMVLHRLLTARGQRP